MRAPVRWSSALLALAVSSAIPACADDAPATTIDFGDGGSTTMGSAPTTSASGVYSTASGPGSGSATGTGGETEDDTTATSGGVEALPGQTASQLVSAGGRSTSRSYVLLYSVGQPSQLQSTHESESYRLRGGLVGANGSPP